MSRTCSDREIESFMTERKPLPLDWRNRIRLQRYNGKSHEHTNHIEDVTFYILGARGCPLGACPHHRH